MVLLAHLLSALSTLLLPFLVGAAIQRRLGAPWGLFGAGAITFVLSQVVHIPLNLGVAVLVSLPGMPTPSPQVVAVLVPLALGLSAGLCEEGARWLALQGVDARTWSRGLMFGAGHGGVEALLVGVIALATWFQLVALHDADLGSRFTPENAAIVRAAADAYYQAPLPMAVAGLFERACAIGIHLACASLVVRAVARKQPVWLLAAIAWHAAVDAGAVMLVKHGVFVAETWVALFALGSAGVVVALREPDPPVVPTTPLVPVRPRKTPLASGDAVDDSRYQ